MAEVSLACSAVRVEHLRSHGIVLADA